MTKIDFFELKDELKYTQKRLVSSINELAITKHLMLEHLKKLTLIDKDFNFEKDFAFLGVVPSDDIKGEVFIVIPKLGLYNDDIYLFDSTLKPTIKIDFDRVIKYSIRDYGSATIKFDEFEMVVGVVPNNEYLFNLGVANFNNKKDGVLQPEFLSKPLKIGTPLKSRVFEVGKTYQVIKVHDERGEYFEETNRKIIETGILVDVKIDAKNTIRNVICNSKLEQFLSDKDFKLPFNFKIIEKIKVHNKKTGKLEKTYVKLIDADKKTVEYNLDELGLI